MTDELDLATIRECIGAVAAQLQLERLARRARVANFVRQVAMEAVEVISDRMIYGSRPCGVCSRPPQEVGYTAVRDRSGRMWQVVRCLCGAEVSRWPLER